MAAWELMQGLIQDDNGDLDFGIDIALMEVPVVVSPGDASQDASSADDAETETIHVWRTADVSEVEHSLACAVRLWLVAFLLANIVAVIGVAVVLAITCVIFVARRRRQWEDRMVDYGFDEVKRLLDEAKVRACVRVPGLGWVGLGFVSIII